MGSVLGSIFGFGNKMKRRLRDAVSNPSDYAEMTADENRNEWRKNPDERSLGFFNPVPLGTMGNFVLRKSLEDALPSMSRREFMKKSAGLAGGTAAASIPGTKLLQKFAPEEKAIAKEVAVEAAPKYRYNSLKEYLDDVSTKAEGDILMSEHPWSESRHTEDVIWRLKNDEIVYNNAKRGKELGDVLPNDKYTLNEFSPQAKKEMKEYKDFVKQYRPSENGQRWARPDDIQDWLAGDRIPF